MYKGSTRNPSRQSVCLGGVLRKPNRGSSKKGGQHDQEGCVSASQLYHRPVDDLFLIDCIFSAYKHCDRRIDGYGNLHTHTGFYSIVCESHCGQRSGTHLMLIVILR